MKPRGIWTAPDGIEIPWFFLQDFDLDVQYLLHRARQERKHAYAPYSDFLVGVAAFTASGAVRGGHNSENVIYDVIHGEGCALSRLELTDFAQIKSLAVVAAPDEKEVELVPAEAPVTCCGKCRQMIWEFCDADTNMPIFMSDPLLSRVWQTTIGLMLPAAFGPETLGISPRKYMQKRVQRVGQ